MSNWTQSGYDPSLHNFFKGVIDDKPNEGYPLNYYYADTLRSLCIGFGNFFNDLYVIRYDEKGEPIKVINVPLKFGPRSKSFDYRVERESGKKYYVQLPNLTYRISGIQFAQERAAGQKETRAFYSQYFTKNGIDYVMANQFWKDIQPVPYNITFEMEAKTEHISDANQILEQICSRFCPEAFFDLKEFWFVNIRRAIKMKLDSSNMEINQEFGEEDKREITVSFTFTVEAFFYKPIERSYIIDNIITKLNVNNENHKWENDISGNYDGTFNHRYDIEKGFGTKIGRVSAMLPYYNQPSPITDSAISSVFNEYKYEELPDLTNYPLNSKQLTATSAIYDPTSALYNRIIKEGLRPEEIPSAYSSCIYETKYDENFKYEDSKGGCIISFYNDLSGFGTFDYSRGSLGYKDYVDLGTKVVSAAPYVSITKLEENLD